MIWLPIRVNPCHPWLKFFQRLGVRARRAQLQFFGFIIFALYALSRGQPLSSVWKIGFPCGLSRRYMLICSESQNPTVSHFSKPRKICAHLRNLRIKLSGLKAPTKCGYRFSSRYQPDFRVPSRITSPAAISGLSRSSAPCFEIVKAAHISEGVMRPRC